MGEGIAFAWILVEGALLAWLLFDAQGFEQRLCAELHEAEFGDGLKELEALRVEAFDFFGAACGTAEPFAVPLSGGDDLCDGFIEHGVVLSTTQTEREGEVTDADKEDIDAGSRGDLFDLLDAGSLFDDADDKNIGIGGVVVVA